MLNEEQLEQVIETPLGDDDIKQYFPNAKVIVYSELSKYNSIEELLPKDKDFIFLLLESSPNKGHWVALTRYGDTVEFFDSYGGSPDSQLKWNNKKKNEELGQGEKYLTELLKGHQGNVVYNPIKYQGDSGDVNTCGRHCTFRIQNMKEGKNLDNYYQQMKALKSNMGTDYDGVVANFIRR